MLKILVVLLMALGFSAARPGIAIAGEDADVVEARRLYNEAKKAFEDERYRDAALAFEGASRLRPHAVALYTAAQAWEAASEPARAADAYSFALATPKLSAEQAERARARLAALQKRLGTVVAIGSEGTRVQLDDHNEVTIPARLHGAAGEHTVLILRDDGSVDRRKVTLTAGESLELDTDSRQEEAAESEERETKPLAEPHKRPVRIEHDRSRSPPSLWKTIGFVSTGAGVAALGGAALLGLSATSAEDAYKAGPTRDSFDHAKSVQTRTNVMLVVGSMLTAGGVGLIVWQSTKEGARSASISIDLGGARAEGRF